MIRVGVIGVGHMGWLHARTVPSLESCRLAAVHDIDAPRAARAAQDFGAAAAASLDELAAICDAAIVAVPTSDHHAVATRCLERGLHVLVEKPVAETCEQADDLVRSAARAGRIVCVGHVERFNPVFRAIRERITRPLFVEAHRLAPFVARSLDVDVILDLMIHDLDLILALHGGEVDRVDASGVPVITEREDIASARITFRDGAVANVTASRVSREKMRRIRFFSARAYHSLDLLNRRIESVRLLTDAGGRVEIEAARPARPRIERQELGPVPDANPLADEIADFVGAIRSGRQPQVDAAAGGRALALALSVRRRVAEHLALLRGRG